MLIQHKKELGIKRISKVYVFEDDIERTMFAIPNVHFFMEIEDVPAAELPKDKDGDKKDPPGKPDDTTGDPGKSGGQKVRKSSFLDTLQAFRPRYFHA
jgi:hypothetical protein